jgi:hypothetical protein
VHHARSAPSILFPANAATAAISHDPSSHMYQQQRAFEEALYEESDLFDTVMSLPLDRPLTLAEMEQRVLHAREDLALKIDHFLRSQAKFSSAVPLKFKMSISKVVSDCEKHRRKFNHIVMDEGYKIHNLQHFLAHHPRFVVSGGNMMVGVRHYTPYQGFSESRRVYGYFKCSKCIDYYCEKGVNKSAHKEWHNAYSYQDCYQICYQCEVKVYPFYQRFLRKHELNFDDRAKHDTTRCSRCEHLGHPCYNI